VRLLPVRVPVWALQPEQSLARRLRVTLVARRLVQPPVLRPAQ
jgi:hypothetical protein